MFFEKTVNYFLNSENKIIYTENRRNNFVNNAEQKIILSKMLEIVYAKNSEQFLWENGEQFYLMWKTDFMNAVSWFEFTVNVVGRQQIFYWCRNRFYQCRKIDSIIVKFKHEKNSDLTFRFRKNDFTRCFWENSELFFK